MRCFWRRSGARTARGGFFRGVDAGRGAFGGTAPASADAPRGDGLTGRSSRLTVYLPHRRSPTLVLQRPQSHRRQGVRRGPLWRHALETRFPSRSYG